MYSLTKYNLYAILTLNIHCAFFTLNKLFTMAIIGKNKIIWMSV